MENVKTLFKNNPKGIIKIVFNFDKNTRVEFQNGKRIDYIKYYPGPWLKKDYNNTAYNFNLNI